MPARNPFSFPRVAGRFKNEAEFGRAFRESMRKAGYIAYKIADVGLGDKWVDVTLMAPKDAGGKRFDVELKAISGPTVSIRPRPTGDFELSQILLMDEMADRDADAAWIAVWSKRLSEMAVMRWTEAKARAGPNGRFDPFAKYP